MIRLGLRVKTKRKRKPAKRLENDYKKEIVKFKRRLSLKGYNAIRSEIKKRDLVKTGEMYNSVTWKWTPQGVKFKVGADHASYINKGVNRHQMVYLTKADKPIPLDVANNLFRWASPKSMKQGKWIHPGFKRGKGFMDASVKRVRQEMDPEFRRISRKIFRG